MVCRSAEEGNGHLAGVRVGAVAAMKRKVSSGDVIPEFDGKDGHRNGGSSLLLRGRRLIQVVHHQSWAISESVGGCFRDKFICGGSSKQDAILWEK